MKERMVESVVQSPVEIVVDSIEKSMVRVLHVDDEPDLLMVAKQCLEMQGPFQVDTADSVEEAMAKLEKERYDAVVSDFQMPGKDGLEFLEMLRKNGNTIPFIIFTGKGREEVALRAWSLGGDHYINKAGDPEKVYCELAHCLRTSVEKHVAKARAEETIEKFEGLFRHNPEAAVYLDANFKIVDMNPRFSQLFGYSSEEVKSRNINDVLVPGDLRKEAERLDKDAKNGYASHSTVRKRKDGSLVPVSVSAAPVSFENNLLGYVGIYKDITDLKKMEEKLRVVGGLTRHDVRNKLSVVTGNAYLLRRRLAGNPEALTELAEMENAVRKTEEIFEFASAYEKLGVELLNDMDVGKAVERAVSLSSDLKGVKIVNECGGLTVLADSLLSQLFYNLIDNSLKHGEKTRQIRVYYEIVDANKFELVYEDDGVGIPDNMRSNLFKEGFTSGKGTGYGLFMIKQICNVYGWTIQEAGTRSKGVKFIMTIPRKNL